MTVTLFDNIPHLPINPSVAEQPHVRISNQAEIENMNIGEVRDRITLVCTEIIKLQQQIQQHQNQMAHTLSTSPQQIPLVERCQQNALLYKQTKLDVGTCQKILQARLEENQMLQKRLIILRTEEQSCCSIQ